MKLYIRNMVCIRCKMIVKQALTELDLNFVTVELGRVEIIEDLSVSQKDLLKKSLNTYGLDLIEDKKSILIEQIKKMIIEFVQHTDEPLRFNFSDYLSKRLHHDYTYLANIFSEVEEVNIEHFLIIHKIEKVKELLVYDELSLKEIAYKLQYSSVAHLSNQFKKTTGVTPSHFKNLPDAQRIGLSGF